MGPTAYPPFGEPCQESRPGPPARRRTNESLQKVLHEARCGVGGHVPQGGGWLGRSRGRSALAEWQAAGVWSELRQVLLDRSRAADCPDFSRAAIDPSPVQAGRGRSRPKVGPSPVDRARPGSKHHVLTDGNGIPLRVSLTGAHPNDVTQFPSLGDSPPPVRGKRVRPRRKPRAVYADRGYDHDIYRRRLRERRITPRIARRGQAHGSGLGRAR